MKYEGYMVGPVIRKLRTERGLSVLQASNLTGMSTSSINQIEQGGRNLSMKALFIFMDAYGVDANTVLGIKVKRNSEASIDSKLEAMPAKQQEYFRNTFMYMLDSADRMTA